MRPTRRSPAAAVLAATGAAAVGLATAPATAQRADSGAARPTVTFAGAAATVEAVGKGQGDWTDGGVHAGRRGPRGSVVAELRRVSRFGRSDVAAGLDTYAALGRGRYSHHRVVASPGARVSPRLDANVGLYVPLARVYEVGADARAMVFAADRVALLTGTLGRYVGNGFAQVRATLVPRAGDPGAAGALLYRRYGATADAFVEASATAGREVLAGADGAVTDRRTWSAGLRAQRPLGRRAEAMAGVAYVSDPAFPRLALSGGLRLRR